MLLLLRDSVSKHDAWRMTEAIAAQSVLFGEHDGDHALSDRGIGWVEGVRGEFFVIIIDHEKDRLAIDLERSEVMFLVGVIGVAEIVIDSDGLDDTGHGFGAESGDTGSQESIAGFKVVA